MNVFFSGIGGAGIGPLAIVAKEAGFHVFGSDKQDSSYIDYLKYKGINAYVGQTRQSIEDINNQFPVDWYVYSSAVTMENDDFPEIKFCQENNIKVTKRDDFINYIIKEKNLKMIAIAGTHGKTTTTAMMIWLLQSLNIPISYSLGAKISFGSMGQFKSGSEYFIYEADEFDRNFLKFKPFISIISGIDYDHPDIYPTRTDYYKAFKDFIGQSDKVIAHSQDLEKIGLDSKDEEIDISKIELIGEVNRLNAQLVVDAVRQISNEPVDKLIEIINKFPGVSRRFEMIAKNIYSDYAHTPEKIKGALQIAFESAGENVVVVYEGLHNTRQHFIKDDLKHLFDNVKKLYIVPSYLAREDESLEMLTPQKLVQLVSKPEKAEAMQTDDNLKNTIQKHANNEDLVLCLTAGGGNSLDEWLRREFK
jgi:UDP-N-acetylmuramate--alanine ligase